MERAFSIIKELELEHYFKVVLTKNMSNTIPYHNLKHTLTMMVNAYDIFNDLRNNNALENVDYNENHILKSICIAALFHDFNHSGGQLQSDADNISLAIESWCMNSVSDSFTTGFVVGLIKGTQYPYTDENPSQFIKILRDADMMQWFEPDFLPHVVMGLNKEMLGKSALSEKMLLGQLEFMKAAKFHTSFAKQKYNEFIEERAEQINWLIEVIKK